MVIQVTEILITCDSVNDIKMQNKQTSKHNDLWTKHNDINKQVSRCVYTQERKLRLRWAIVKIKRVL